MFADAHLAAIHEAGHAVASYQLDIPVKWVTPR
jgi:hypothetical protein